jgi:hypothetical protein
MAQKAAMLPQMVTMTSKETNMKYFLCLALLPLFAQANETPTCDPCGVTRGERACVMKDCKPRVVTKTVTKEIPVTVEKRVEVDKTKKHLISIAAHRAVTSSYTRTSPGLAEAGVDIKYVPALLYQYQFDSGLTPMLGVDTQLSPIFGLGFGF